MQRVTDTRTTYRLAGSIPFAGIVADLELARRANAARANGMADADRISKESERVFEMLVQLFPACELLDIIHDCSKASRILFRVSLMVEPVKEASDF